VRGGLLAALAILATAAATALPAAAAKTQARSLIFYGDPARAQFVNHADDRDRGNKTNPFNGGDLPVPPSANSGKKGARAGDNALFSVTLYADRKLTRPVGTALYSCTFNFSQNATCDAHFELGRGTMIAMGPARLDGSPIVLPVIGGTGRYRGAHGQVTSSPLHGKKNTQVIRFQLV
jgi:hypothetical protein